MRAQSLAGRRSLALKRSLSHAALLSSIAIVVAVISGFLVGGAGYLDLASNRVLRSDLAAAAPRTAALRFEAAAADDTARQAARANSVLRRALGRIAAEITRTLESPALTATHDGAPMAGGSSPSVLVELTSDAGLRRESSLVSGQWPEASATKPRSSGAVIDASIQADAARSLGLKLGDELVAGDAPNALTVRLVATWRVTDSRSPRWFADLATTGRATDAANGTATFGPIVIAEGAFPGGGSAPTVRWTVTPRIGEVTTARGARNRDTAAHHSGCGDRCHGRRHREPRATAACAVRHPAGDRGAARPAHRPGRDGPSRVRRPDRSRSAVEALGASRA